VAVAKAHQPVMEVAEVGDSGARPLAGTAHDGEHRVQ
jgi:hypothetical protein